MSNRDTRSIVPASWLGIGFVLMATALSMLATGFAFGVANNAFHIPYVLRYGELAQFRSDALYHSLDQFASLVWPLIRMLSNEGNIEKVFLGAALLSRLLAFIALSWFFRANGAGRGAALGLSLLTAAACAWLHDSSLLGSHGMFIGYFSHTEVTWGPLLAALVAAQRGRLPLAAAFAGLVFSINAFVGVWLAAIIGCTVLADPQQRRDWKTLAWAMLAFLLLCSPVLAWVASDLDKGRAPAFSYIDYIRTYYSKHFLIEAEKPQEILTVLLLAWCGFAVAKLQRQARFWMAALAGCVLLLLVGTVLPYVLNQRFVFNLHLLRSDGVLQFIAAGLAIAAAVPLLIDAQAARAQRLLALLALCFLLSPPLRWSSALICALAFTALAYLRTDGRGAAARHQDLVAILVCIAALAIDAGASAFSPSLPLRWVAILGGAAMLWSGKGSARMRTLVLVGAWGVFVALSVFTEVKWRAVAQQKEAQAQQPVYEMMRWVRSSALQGSFLFPVDLPHRSVFESFQLLALRPVWVDWKQGAAVMWAPSFHAQWMPRYLEVSRLHTAAELAAYAADKRIPWLVLPADMGTCPATTAQVFRNAGAAVCRVGPGPGPNQ